MLANASNGCLPISQWYPDIIDNRLVQVLLGLMFCLMCIFGALGNIGVLYCLTLTKVQFNVQHIFIWNLAIADMCLALFALPTTAVQIFSRTWVFGTLLCHMVPFLQSTSVFVTSFTLVSIAYDRYVVTRHPTRAPRPSTSVILTALITWILAFTAASPYTAFMKVKSSHRVCGWFCEEVWPSDRGQLYYGLSVMFVQFVAPLVISWICYHYVYRSVISRVRRRVAKEDMSLRTRSRLLRSQKHVNNMITAMLLSFVIAWLPINLINLLRDMGVYGYLIPEEAFTLVFAIAYLSAMTSCLWNPVIYAFCNQEFQQALAKWVPQCFINHLQRQRLTPSQTEHPLGGEKTTNV